MRWAPRTRTGYHAAMTSAVNFAAEATEHTIELPFPAPYFGLVALAIFLLLLGITWTFRNAAHKLGQHPATTSPGQHATAPHEPGNTL